MMMDAAGIARGFFAFETSASSSSSSCLRSPPSSQHTCLHGAFSPPRTCLANLDSLAVRISCTFSRLPHRHCPPSSGPRSVIADHNEDLAVVSVFDDSFSNENRADGLSPSESGQVQVGVDSADNATGSSLQLRENGRESVDQENVVKQELDSERFQLRHGRQVFEERAYLVGIERKGQGSTFGIEDSLAELAQLADTAGLLVVGSTHQKLDHPSPRTYIGSGKVSELRTAVGALDIETIIFDDELSPGQLRNLGKALGNEVRVCDRTALILDIFSQRAATREATLQVELAQMDYQLPRLTKMWAHLERQAGGLVKGMGEKQIEVDKRILRNRIAALRKELDSVREHRQQYRDRRGSVPIPVVSLVGYTNAGKSTLLNRLSGADVIAEDRLFATLDPTTRRIELPNGNECLLTDTVGFIQKLPTQLVASFRATLEEINDSSLLVHVVDISHPLAKEQMEAVESVLAELNVEHIPQMTVWNKVDRAEKQNLREEAESRDDVVCISALTGEGVASLCKAIQSKLKESLVWVDVLVPYGKGEFVNIMHRLGVVASVEYMEEGISLKGHVPLALSRQLQPMRQTA